MLWCIKDDFFSIHTQGKVEVDNLLFVFVFLFKLFFDKIDKITEHTAAEPFLGKSVSVSVQREVREIKINSAAENALYNRIDWFLLFSLNWLLSLSPIWLCDSHTFPLTQTHSQDYYVVNMVIFIKPDCLQPHALLSCLAS